MFKSKYEKNIVTELKSDIVEAPWQIPSPSEVDLSPRILYLDDSVVKGAFFLETCWMHPSLVTDQGDVLPHKHDFDEVLALFGSDIKDPHNLGGELEIWLGGEKHIVTKSCIVFIPKGIEHGPIKFNKIDRPIFHFACGMTKKYSP
jgi:hypothetical protein